MSRWQKEHNIEEIIKGRIGSKRSSACYVFVEGRDRKSESVDISYYWSDSAGGHVFGRSYPASTAELSEEEIAEMFLLDWVFGQ